MKKIYRLILSGLLFAYSGAVAKGTSRLPQIVAAADAIVIGKVTGGDNTNDIRELEFSVVHVIKGELAPGALIRASFRARDRAGNAPVPPVLESGLIFLKHVGVSSFELLSVDTGDLGLRGAYFPVPKNVRLDHPGSASPLEQVHAELIAAIEARSDDEQYLKRIVPKLSPGDSAIVVSALQRWSASASGPLQLLAMGSLIGAGSNQAVIGLKTELRASPTSVLAKSVATNLSTFRGTDPAAVAALGEIATTSAAEQGVQESAAFSLQRIHTRQTLPALKALLDSPHPLVRQLAVSGFTAFALQMRIPRDDTDAAEALDEILNPGRRRTIPSADAPFDTAETRQFAHFGPFRDLAEETRFITFWKEWYEKNSGHLP